MDFSKSQIALLVLGYLKNEKCSRAYEEFLNTCEQLKAARQNINKGERVGTRIFGYGLEDILAEYQQICTTVQGYLEDSDYYEKNGKKGTIVEHLAYLLDNKEQRMFTSSPLSFRKEKAGKDVGTNTLEALETDATPSLSLSGNVQNHGEKISHRSSKRSDKSNKSSPEEGRESPSQDDDVSMVLTQTLLENRELHEKLAETINTVIHNTERLTSSNPEEKVCTGVSTELDALIKTVVQRTEEDPIFNKLLDEINDLACDNPSTSKSKTSLDGDNKCDSDEHVERPPEGEKVGNKSIEESNNDAIQSIIAVASSVDCTSSSQKKTNPNAVSVESARNIQNDMADLVVFNNPGDNNACLNPTSSASASTSVAIQNPVYINTGGGLYMVPSTVSTNPATTTSKIFLLNSQPVLNMNMNVQPISTPMLSEHDIMSMPVIISDTITSQPLILPTNFTTNCTEAAGTRKNSLLHIAPKLPVPSVISSSTICTNSQPESVTLYAGEPERVVKEECKQESKETYTLPITRNRSKQNLLAMQKKSGEPGCSLPTLLEKTISPERNKPQEKGKSKQSDVENPPNCKTPEERKPAKSKTPKSGSHVRNLDFSSPPRTSASRDRANKSKETAKNGKKSRSSSKSPSKKSSLHSQSNIEPKKVADVAVKSKKPKPNTWDAKLRELLPSYDREQDANKSTRRPQNKTPRKKPSKKKSNRNENELSKEAKMLEAAIATPKKSVPSNDKCAEVEGKPDLNMEIDETCGENQKIETEPFPSNKIDERKADDDKEENEINIGSEEQELEPEPEPEPEVRGVPLNKDPEELIQTATISTTLIVEDMKLKYSLRNINSGPKFKKKCNTNPQQVLINENDVAVSESNSQSVAEKSSKLLLLSPSKLNANKRNIVTSETKSKLNENFVTPENTREGYSQEIDAAKRNIMPLLQTPEKNSLPKTPNLESCYTPAPPNNHTPGCTPFTKVLEEHLKDVDLMSITTPKLPITPDFALTPGEFHSTYSSRPTDYSTSSSYYQPSDGEQRSLGQLIKENDRLESTAKQSTIKVISDVTIERETETDDRNKLIAEHMRSFINRTAIAKKNLNLINKNRDSSSSDDESDSSSSDSSSSSKSSDISWAASQCSDTVIHRSDILETIPSSYKLRNRAMSVKKNSNDSKESNNTATVKEVKQIEIEGIKKRIDCSNKTEEKIDRVPEINKHKSIFNENSCKRVRTLNPIKNPLNRDEVIKHKTLFEEINAKRIRTLNAIKNPPVVKKVQSSHPNKRSAKDTEQKNARKSGNAAKKRIVAPPSAKKPFVPSKSIISKIREDLNLPEISVSVKNKKNTSGNPETEDEEIVLHLSSDDEGLEPSQLVETQLLEYSNSPSATPDNPEIPAHVKSTGTFKNISDIIGNKKHLLGVDLEAAKILGNLEIKSLPVNDRGGSETVKNIPDNVTNEKSVSEADKLVLGLKERGIHLMHNKSPGKSSACNSSNASNESQTNDYNNSENQININLSNNSTKNESRGDVMSLEVQVETSAAVETAPIIIETAPIIIETAPMIVETPAIVETSNNQQENRSLSEPADNFELLEDIAFDQKEYNEENLSITFDEKQSHRTAKYDCSILDKIIEANVFMEELDLEMVRIIRCTPFIDLLHIESTVNDLIPKKTPTPRSSRPSHSSSRERHKTKETKSRKTVRETSRSAAPAEDAVASTKSGGAEKEATEDSRLKRGDPVEEMKPDNPDDELFNWAAAGTLQESDPASPETTVSPKTSRKRKCSDGEDIPNKKKCAELLKKLDVDLFLNRVHGDDKCT